MTDLRPYQTECLQSVKNAYRDGLRRVLVSLPTGTGKTVVFASFPEFFKMQKRMLVLAHREELLDQACKKFRERAPNFKVGIEQGDRQAADNCDVVIASVPTLGRVGSARLQRLDPSAFYLIVVDEAHHAVAESYKRVLQHFRVFEEGSPRLLVGFTATPKRGDGKALGEIFQDIAFTRGLEEMIRQGYLSSIVGWRVATEIGLDNVKVVAGDFSESQLARAVNTTERNEIVLKAYWQKARDRRASCSASCNTPRTSPIASPEPESGPRRCGVTCRATSERRPSRNLHPETSRCSPTAMSSQRGSTSPA